MKKYKGYEFPTTIEEITNGNGTIEEFRIDIDGIDVLIHLKDNVSDINNPAEVEKYIVDTVKEYIDNYMNQVDAFMDPVKEIKKINDDIKMTKKRTEVVNKMKQMITEDQAEKAAKELDDVNKDNKNIQYIKNLPSNNGKLERSEEEIEEKGEFKIAQVEVDPNTGAQKINSLEELSNQVEEDTFEKLVSNLDNYSFEDKEKTPIEEEDVKKYIEDNKNKIDGKENQDPINKLLDLPEESIKNIIEIANRRISKEKFNVYKAFDINVKTIIDSALIQYGIVPIDMSVKAKTMRNTVSEELLDEFIDNINFERIQNDFSKEIENIFSTGEKEIAEQIVGYSKQKIQSYRDALDKIEDPEKKKKLSDILDNIDEANNLTKLKEFAFKCKIKKIELEKPERIYDDFLNKYNDSKYNVYSINMARPILYRALNSNEEENTYTDKDVNAFFISFCKQTMNYSVSNPIEHAYMYFVIYNVVLLELVSKLDPSDSEYIKNVKEVIANLRKRNNY